jgi:hypothetical protein
MKSNPTLIVIYFSYSQYDESTDKLEVKKNPNLYVISPEPDFSFEKATNYLSKVFFNQDDSSQHENEQ